MKEIEIIVIGIRNNEGQTRRTRIGVTKRNPRSAGQG